MKDLRTLTSEKRIITIVIALIAAAMIIASCTNVPKNEIPEIKPPVEIKPIDPGPMPLHLPAWENGTTERVAWTTHVKEAILQHGNGLLNTKPKDVGDFSTNYQEDKEYRLHFWAYLISRMAKLESDYNPHLQYRENFRDRHGNYVISRGLLQLSYESGLGYGCPFKDPKDIHDPKSNLICGVKILNKWVVADNRITGEEKGWKGGGRYWSVLRTASKVNEIKKATKERF